MGEDEMSDSEFFDRAMLAAMQAIIGAVTTEDEYGIIHNTPSDVAEISRTYAQFLLSERNQGESSEDEDQEQESGFTLFTSDGEVHPGSCPMCGNQMYWATSDMIVTGSESGGGTTESVAVPSCPKCGKFIPANGGTGRKEEVGDSAGPPPNPFGKKRPISGEETSSSSRSAGSSSEVGMSEIARTYLTYQGKVVNPRPRPESGHVWYRWSEEDDWEPGVLLESDRLIGRFIVERDGHRSSDSGIEILPAHTTQPDEKSPMDDIDDALFASTGMLRSEIMEAVGSRARAIREIANARDEALEQQNKPTLRSAEELTDIELEEIRKTFTGKLAVHNDDMRAPINKVIEVVKRRTS